MIPHHEQAIEVAQLAPTNSKNEKLVTLANNIAAEQTPEISALNNKLTLWGDEGSSVRDGHGGAGMVGMIDDAAIERLTTLQDDAFDRLWLTSMITHHQGAIAMAQDEVDHGQDADLKYLATRIIDAQRAEIEQMKQMLGG